MDSSARFWRGELEFGIAKCSLCDGFLAVNISDWQLAVKPGPEK